MSNYQEVSPGHVAVLVDSATGAPVGLRRPNSYSLDMVQPVGSTLPFVQYNAISTASGVFSAAVAVGAQEVIISSSGATALTTPTAAAMLAALPKLPANGVGLIYFLRVINTNAGTLTLTMDASVTGNGTLTIATNTFRDFMVTFNTASTATWQSIGTGTNS